jgi:hypothetical protein
MIHFDPKPRVLIYRYNTPPHIFEWLMDKMHVPTNQRGFFPCVQLYQESPIIPKFYDLMAADRDVDIHARLDRLEYEAWRSMANQTSNPILQGAYEGRAEAIFLYSLVSAREYAVFKNAYQGNEFRRAMMNNRGIHTNS